MGCQSSKFCVECPKAAFPLQNAINNNFFKVYYIKCENEAWYIGVTSNSLEERFEEHNESHDRGAVWTKINRPISIHLHKEFPTRREAAIEETSLTLAYMTKYGVSNVRGGRYSSPILNRFVYLCLKSEMAHVENLCFKCLKPGHFAKFCNSKDPIEIVDLK